MANPKVEKMKALGLKHGEKAVVGLAVALFLLFVFQAITKKTIEMKPEELAEKAKSADSNLNKQQKPEDILAKIEAAGVKSVTEFEKTVDKAQSKALNPAEYVVKSKWVTPEPGAGLIRDQPELIAIEDLAVFPNRGGYLVYELNEKGERIPDLTKGDAPVRKARLGKLRRRGGMMGGGSSGSSGGMGDMMVSGGLGAPTSAKGKAKAEEKRKDDEATLKKSLVGTADDKPAEKGAADPAAVAVQANFKETTKGYRSVVVTGTLDNKKLRENYLAALKESSLAYPNYKRVDAQRQILLPTGKWTEFAYVDIDAKYRVLDNLPEVDDELVPKSPGPLLEALVDQLPFAKAGFWSGVHIASLVPKDKREIPKPAAGTSNASEMMMGMGGSSGSSAMSGSRMPGGGGMPMSSSGGSEMSMSGSGAMSSMMGSGGGKPGGPVDETDFEKSESDDVMIRSIDFTVQADMTYRYRVRIVVVNPNYLRNDVSPGTDTDAAELKGPWSETSPEVTVPPDVAAYAIKTAPPTRRNDQVTFQVVRWNPEDGHTVVRTDEAGPGELIGNLATTDIPSSDGKGVKKQPVDFNTHRFVLDTTGGTHPIPSALKAGPSLEVPAFSLVLRPDGTVAVHGQARDAVDEVRLEIVKSYQQAIKDSGKKREPGMGGSMMPGMMGSGSMGGR